MASNRVIGSPLRGPGPWSLCLSSESHNLVVIPALSGTMGFRHELRLKSFVYLFDPQRNTVDCQPGGDLTGDFHLKHISSAMQARI